MVPSKSSFFPYCSNAWERAHVSNGSKYLYEMSIEDELIFNIIHLAIHFLFLYLLTVYTSTALSRKRILSEEEMLPVFWSWQQALSGRRYVQYMVIENIIMLMPIGLFLPFIINKRYVALQTILFGAVFSLFIEVSQKVLHVGFFEVDDLLNNIVGVALGCTISSVFKNIIRLKNRSK